jgi:hypothetical protein
MSVSTVASSEEYGSLALLALGLRATLDRFDGLLAKYAPEGGDEVPPLDDATAVVLGAIAIASRLAAKLDAVPAPMARTVPREAPGGEWLR